jgi:predicted DNA-binding transcriptional regulator AlpA
MASTRKRKRAAKTGAPIGAALTGHAALALARMGDEAKKQREAKRLEEELVSKYGREFLLDREVDRVVSLGRSQRWRARKANPPQFPEPVKLGPNRLIYWAADIAAVVAGTWQPPTPRAAAV